MRILSVEVEPHAKVSFARDAADNYYLRSSAGGRHRAFAFLVSALAAGIPARYLSNEAHAWAEVWAPQKGWMRVDLGGAAVELDVANASDKTIHRPRGKDPFPKPRAYAEGYTRL